MITREQLVVLLRNAGVEEQTIDRILKKKIKTLLARGKAKEIEDIFKVLDEHEIRRETIEN